MPRSGAHIRGLISEKKMKVSILNRFNRSEIFAADIGDDTAREFRMRAALKIALEQKIDLICSDFSGADLTDLDLRGADLTGSDFRCANLTGSDFRGGDFLGADFSGADFSGAQVSGANLSAADWTPIRDDIWSVLSSAPAEVPALINALKNGRVDGSTYEGYCACLIGTIANTKGCSFREVAGIKPNPTRPAERFFLGIKKGDTPETNQFSKMALEWSEDWLARMQATF